MNHCLQWLCTKDCRKMFTKNTNGWSSSWNMAQIDTWWRDTCAKRWRSFAIWKSEWHMNRRTESLNRVGWMKNQNNLMEKTQKYSFKRILIIKQKKWGNSPKTIRGEKNGRVHEIFGKFPVNRENFLNFALSSNFFEKRRKYKERGWGTLKNWG